jgi:hypothetical protein
MGVAHVLRYGDRVFHEQCRNTRRRLVKTEPSSNLFEVSGGIHGLGHVYFCAYHHAVRAGHTDTISHYLRDFNEGVEPQASRWISFAAPLICSAGPFDLVVRVLRSGELAADGTSGLDRLCKAVALQSGATYAPGRLVKTRTTRTLQGLGGRAAHRKELDGAYVFDGSAIKAGARILVVDDILTTGSTLEVVAGAIHASLPDSEIVGFVLGKTDGTSSNAHLDPGFFVASVESPAADPEEIARMKASASRKAQQRKTTVQKKRTPISPPQAPVPPTKERSSVMVYVFGVALTFVILGAIVPLRSGRTIRPAESTVRESFPPPERISREVQQIAVSAASPRTPEDNPRPAAERKNLRPGIVNVPAVGLRKNHSLESKIIPKAAVRHGDRIEIVSRFLPESGPGWLQVRTQSGKVGWIIASGVKEQKTKS